jgi:hypothetical protein
MQNQCSRKKDEEVGESHFCYNKPFRLNSDYLLKTQAFMRPKKYVYIDRRITQPIIVSLR